MAIIKKGAASTKIAEGKIIVGNASGVGAAVTPSGDVSITAAGAFTLAAASTSVAGKVQLVDSYSSTSQSLALTQKGANDMYTAVMSSIGGNKTTHRVADLTALGVLEGVKVGDFALVTDDGDGNWALYIADTVNGSGVVQTKTKLADYNGLANSIPRPLIYSESVEVDVNTIVLANKPVGGVILNFATVRNIADGVATDVPVVIDGTDATGKTFTLQPDVSGDFDNLNVTVQYFC